MKALSKYKASLLVSTLIILTFILTIFLLVYTYASNNLQHAKKQEEGLHAYYLAYSGAEIALESLKNEANDLVLVGSESSKWAKLAEYFKTPPDANFLPRHKVSISYEGKLSEPGYVGKEFQRDQSGKTGKELSELLLEMKDAIILIEVTRVSETYYTPEEEDYKGFIRIRSTAKKALNSGFEGMATKFLYVDPNNPNKYFWK